MSVKLMQINDGALQPIRATPGSHGYDLAVSQDVEIDPGATALLPTGLKLADTMPPQIAMTIWPRSSTFKKYGLLIGNSIGLVDQDYTGEIMIMVHNTRQTELYRDPKQPWVKPLWRDAFEACLVRLPAGTKIAQLVFVPVVYPEIMMQQNFVARAERGGFGSTG